MYLHGGLDWRIYSIWENKNKITIVQVNSEEETNDEDRPYAVNIDWVEIIDGKVNGRYRPG